MAGTTPVTILLEENQTLTGSSICLLRLTSLHLINYLNPNCSSMKLIAWNCQGARSFAFRNHAHEIYRRHRPQILIIVEPRIAEKRAQVVIDNLPYSRSQRVDLVGFSGDIWMLWNECSQFRVEILTTSDYSIHALVKVPPFFLNSYLCLTLF